MAPPVVRRPRRGSTVLAATAVVVVAAALRLTGTGRAYELFVDEVSYANLSRSVAQGRGVLLYGEPFNLHPPGVFVLFGGLLRLLGLADATTVSAVLALRPVEALIGSASCGLLFLLLRRVVRPWVAAAGAALLVLDPFITRFDSRVMLEAPASFFALLGLWLLVRSLDPPTRHRTGGAVAGVGAGTALGAAVLCKDTLAFVTVLPVVLLLVVLAAHRRLLVRTLVASAVPYALYLVWVLLSGDGGAWLQQKGSGFARLTGAQQTTGFNVPGSVPLTTKLAQLLGSYAATYAIIAAGCLVGLVVALRTVVLPRVRRRPAPELPVGMAVVLAWQVSAAALLTYAVLFGTLEEQMFYLLLVPSVAGVAVGAELLLQGGWRPVGLRRAVTVVVVLALALDGLSWWRVHTTRDDGYLQFLAWSADHLSSESRLSVTEDTAQFITPGVVLGDWSTPEELRANRADYVLLSLVLTTEGYGSARPALVAWLDRNATVVYQSDTPTLGVLRVYHLSPVAPTP